jgi:hypothetical protein
MARALALLLVFAVLGASAIVCGDKYAGKQCEYRRKSKLTAFLLTLLVPCGGCAGSFYIGQKPLGAVGVILTAAWIALVTCFCCFCFLQDADPFTRDPENWNGCYYIFSAFVGTVALLIILSFALQLATLIAVLTGALTDGRGNALYNDMQ